MRSTKLSFVLSICFLLGQALALLGIKQDTTAPNGYYHWSSAARFSDDPSVVVDQLPSLAMVAYNEMVTDYTLRRVMQSKQPAAMAALYVDGTVYFSSSLRGPGSFLVDPTQGRSQEAYVNPATAEAIRLAVLRCQQAFVPYDDGTGFGGHRYAMKCAEPLAMQTFIVENPTIDISGGSIATYGAFGVKAPCSNLSGNWGCSVLLPQIKVTGLGNTGDQPGPLTLSLVDGSITYPCFWS